jgi:hypothetical protein
MIDRLVKADFDIALSRDSYYRGRWDYYNEAADLGLATQPNNCLELGCHTLPLYKQSVTMDVDATRNPAVIHNAETTPWPFDDKQFDLFVALQVWEHLGDRQVAAFNEVRRVAKTAVLSFPLMWMDEPLTDFHHGITMEKIAGWTMNVAPQKVVIMPPWSHKRAIYMFDFRTS